MVPAVPIPPQVSGPNAAACARALQPINYPWQRLGYPISCEGPSVYGGRTLHSQHRIAIYVHPDWSSAYLTRVLAHEIGHVVEYYSIHKAADPAARKQAWIDARGLTPSTDWWGESCAGCAFQGPTEDFAETFARWQARPADWAGKLAGPPNDVQLQALTAFFDTGLMPPG